MPTLTFTPATADDWPAIATLLTEAHLPLAGAEEHLPHFLLASRDGGLVAAAGLEVYGEHALLRSVAVAESARGTGVGQEMVRRLLEEARALGVRSVALLTTTAAGFFPRFGFATVPRAEIPSALHASTEFQGACPASAVAMLLELP